jgi:sugar (pentulose or hexulose) kinase
MHSQQWRADGNHTVLIGLDLGTSGLKGVAVDLNGFVIARGQATYITHRPEPGASEQNPQDWLEACRLVISQIAEQIPQELWVGIGLSGMIPTLVCLDEESNPVGSAITWEDGRADSFGEAFRSAYGIAALYETTGQLVDGRYLIPMWRRLCEVEPQRAIETITIASAKDFLFGALTGVVETDPSTATGYGCYNLVDECWDESILQHSGISVKVPNLAASDTWRPTTEIAASTFDLPQGLPICIGAADSVLGAMGMGITAPGQIAYVAGTSTVILGIFESIPLDPKHRFIVTPMAEPGTWGVEMDLLSTGGAIRWLSELFGEPSETAALELASKSTSKELPTFLPYVSPGEQGALWDPNLSGTIHGLHLSHSKGDIMKALVDGILLESWRCISVLEEFEFRGEFISVAGGSALHPWFRQQLADVLQRIVIAPIDGDSDYSALGAALNLAKSQAMHVKRTERQTMRINPDPELNTQWQEKFAQFEAIRLSQP